MCHTYPVNLLLRKEMKFKMKKSLVAAVLTIGLAGNVFASCDNTPYVAPEELQPACAEKTPVAQGVATPPADKFKVSEEIDSKSKLNADSSKKLVSEQLSQGGVK